MIRNDWVLGIFGRDSQQDLLMVWIWNMRENSKITQGFSLSNLVNGGATSCSGQRGRLSLKKKIKCTEFGDVKFVMTEREG